MTLNGGSKKKKIVVSFQSQETNGLCAVYKYVVIVNPFKLVSWCPAGRCKEGTESDIDEERNGRRKWERRRCALLHVTRPN